MNAIPPLGPSEEPYDFVWSVCALEHLGNLERGLEFVERSLSVLKPGGVAVHTTEFNADSNEKTLGTGGTVLYRKKDLQALFERLEAQKHKVVGPPDFSSGRGFLDRYVDVPPYDWEWDSYAKGKSTNLSEPQVRVGVGDYAATCFGIIVVKAS